MSDHQFEKNVRKHLEELKFHPTASVWTSVEKRIALRKKKNRGILWIPLLLLLTAGGIYLLERNDNPTNQAPLTTSVVPAERSTESVTPETAQPSNTENRNSTIDNPTSENKQPAPTTTSAEATRSSDQLITRKNEKIKSGSTDQPRVPSSKKSSNPLQELPESVAGSDNKQTSVAASNAVVAERTNRKTPVTENAAAGLNVRIEQLANEEANTLRASLLFAPVSLTGNKDKISILSPAVISESSATTMAAQLTASDVNTTPLAVAPPVERKKSTIQWGVTVDAGFSNVTEGGFFDVAEKSMVQDVASNSYSSPLPANAVLPMPSDIRPAPSFGAGFFVRKPVSKRIALSAGLGYSLLQTSIQVGQYSQGSLMVLNARGSMGVEAVYRAGTQQEYKNQYHFIEMPLEGSVRLNKRRQYPIALNAGVSLARLVSSNALHFDGATRVYYEDNSLFNKTQIGFSTGLSIGFLQNTAHPVSAGPFFHYRATNLMKYPVNGERHLLSFGMNIKVLMKK